MLVLIFAPTPMLVMVRNAPHVCTFLALVACASEPVAAEPEPSPDGGMVDAAAEPRKEAPTDGGVDAEANVESSWAPINTVPGASSRTRAVAGSDVLLVYGGCGASRVATEGFADALAASPTWQKRAPAQLIAVQWTSSGCGYDGAFKNSVLGPLVSARAGNGGRVIVVAHSSGAYVAQEWLAQALGASTPAWDPSGTIAARSTYFCLDGGGDTNLSLIEKNPKKMPLFFVGARGSGTNFVSRNHATMKVLAGGSERFIEVDASLSGCETSNCLHDAVITTLPHNRRGFVDDRGTSQPLWCDYSHFPPQPHPTCEAIDQQSARSATRAVVGSYLSRLQP
ncbi:MAG: hypothetical protein U0174_28545 [Polyangiaceae bacterium]